MNVCMYTYIKRKFIFEYIQKSKENKDVLFKMLFPMC